MTVRELREKYLAFFESKGHRRFPSGSLIPYDVTGRLDESLLFNGAGMIQFKPYFRGIAQPEHKRLTTVQKCVRTGDIEEVGDPTHLTFFEMLGNFSFGDYFKAQAIAFSWEFLTGKEWLGLDPRRLSFTIFEEDEEAFNEWAFWVVQADLKPETRIFRLGEETNYWPAGAFSAGPPGPCGPNSEMFYWVAEEEPPTGDYTREQWIADDAAGKWVEIWNDVFIQYEWQGHLKDPSNPKLGYQKDDMPELPFRSIDTGMGLERTALVLSGGKSVYDSDVFQPILRAIENAGKEELRYNQDPVTDSAIRVVADHTRTAVFCIADGILPGNTGRGYVLRRLIRRAVLKGQRVLGFDQPFLHLVFEGVRESMGDFYTELTERQELIAETLRNEEALFRRTLAGGTQLLNQLLEQHHAGVGVAVSPDNEPRIEAELVTGEMDLMTGGTVVQSRALPGADAFKLYDTYGFPLEVTIELAQEAGVEVDVEGYEKALKEAQDRSRGAQDRESVYGGVTDANEFALPDAPASTDFTGYDRTEGEATIVRVRPGAEGRLRVALDQTPFYAESGGQIGDHGALEGDGFTLNITNTTKSAGTFWHDVDKTDLNPADLLGKRVRASVVGGRRARIVRNHTATHLLQAALRQVLGTHVTQAGSYVGPDGLRFDFTHGRAMTEEERAQVERIVNEQALRNDPVTTYADIPIAEAKARGAMALFGEKYGDRVRMVEIGEFSRELCGGTHVRTTGEIGLFKITGESSAASGVRRIEAITGEAAYEYELDEARRLREAANLLKASPRDLVGAVERVLEGLREERRRREKAEMAAMSGGGKTAESSEGTEVNGVRLWRKNFGDVDQKLAASAVDNEAAGKGSQVTLAAVVNDGRVTFICKVGPEAVAKGAHAGNLIREVAKIAGGGGGGRPDFATAGGKQPEKADEALSAAESVLAGMIK
jgi:alanyl-tRNA synthetase